MTTGHRYQCEACGRCCHYRTGEHQPRIIACVACGPKPHVPTLWEPSKPRRIKMSGIRARRYSNRNT